MLLSISSKYLYFKLIFNYTRKGLQKGVLICQNCDTLLCFRPITLCVFKSNGGSSYRAPLMDGGMVISMIMRCIYGYLLQKISPKTKHQIARFNQMLKGGDKSPKTNLKLKHQVSPKFLFLFFTMNHFDQLVTLKKN